jgi:hypothetical protein
VKFAVIPLDLGTVVAEVGSNLDPDRPFTQVTPLVDGARRDFVMSGHIRDREVFSEGFSATNGIGHQ